MASLQLLLTTVSVLTFIVVGQGVNGCINGDVEIVQGIGDTEIRGFVQYCQDGGWRRVCQLNNQLQEMWSTNEATTACNQLGYSIPVAVNAYGYKMDTTQHPWTGSYVTVNCTSSTLNSLQDCAPTSQDSCHVDRHARLICADDCNDNELRLVGGASEREGRVEVCVDGRWGTVQTNNPGELAQTVCGGYTNLYSTGQCYVSQFGYSFSKPVYNCSSNNSNELTCQNSTNNSHKNDLGVACINSTEREFIINTRLCNNMEGKVRLVDEPTSSREGRVEVCVGGCWGTVCNKNDEEMAELICEQLGFPCQGTEVSSRVFDGVRGYNCTSDVSTNLTCEETSCALALAVRCSTHQQVTAAPSKEENGGSLIAGIVILVLISLALVVGWIVTVITVWIKIHKQSKQDDDVDTKRNESYSLHQVQQQQTAAGDQSDNNNDTADEAYLYSVVSMDDNELYS